jgi:replicative DNA helicase
MSSDIWDLQLGNVDLEAKIINALCSYPDCLDVGVSELQPEFFTDRDHAKLFEIIKAMYVEGKPVTLVTVHEAARPVLSDTSLLRKWVADSAWCSRPEFKFLVDKLREQHKAMRLALMAYKVVQQLATGEEVGDVLKTAQDSIYGISIDTASDTRIFTPKEHATRILDTLTARMDSKGTHGIKTNVWKLNRAINGGFQAGELVILAGQTGRGKSSFALNLLNDIAIVQKIPSLYINTELNDDQIDTRLATIITKDAPGITYQKLATGDISDEELATITHSLDKMHSSGFYSVTRPELTINDVHSIANRFKAQRSIRVLVIDYVGRMETSDPKLKEYQVLRAIAKRLKTLAQSLGITVIMLAQLTEDDKLEGAKGMKNECDLMIYLDEMTNDLSLEYGNAFNYFLVIDKNRNGPRGLIPLKFNGEKLLFQGEAEGESAKIGPVYKSKAHRKRVRRE